MNKLVIALGLTSIVAMVGCTVSEPPATESAAPEPVGAGAQPLADVPDFRITGITGRGPGCRTPDSLSWLVTEDKLTFAVYFSDMVLNHAPGGQAYQTTNCTVGVNLHIPQGWMFSLATINTRGFAQLPKLAVAKEISTYSLAGMPFQVEPHSELAGPREGTYVFTDKVGVVTVVESPCGKDTILSINTRTILDTQAVPNSNAVMTVDQVDGKFEKIFHLMWKRC